MTVSRYVANTLSGRFVRLRNERHSVLLLLSPTEPRKSKCRHLTSWRSKCYAMSGFVNLRKASIGFVVSVRQYVRLEQLGSHWTDFHEILYMSILRQSVENTQISLKFDKNNGYFSWRPLYMLLIVFRSFFLAWEMFQIKVVEKIKTNILFSITFFSKIVLLITNVEKFCRAGQVTGNMLTVFPQDTGIQSRSTR
jgi:hypothetical protein